MGDRTQLERIIELEGWFRELRLEVEGLRALMSCVKLFLDSESGKKAKVAERMAKARAGRGKKKGA